MSVNKEESLLWRETGESVLKRQIVKRFVFVLFPALPGHGVRAPSANRAAPTLGEGVAGR